MLMHVTAEKSRLRMLGRLNGLELPHSGGEEQEDDETAASTA